MTYATVISELFCTLPWLEERYEESFAYMEGEEPLPYLVFGSVLLPTLEQAVIAGDLAVILKLAAFLEDASEASRGDSELEELLRIEVGEWLGRLQDEDRLTMWLGPETRRVCRYVPGSPTQRNDDGEDRAPAWWKRLHGSGKKKAC